MIDPIDIHENERICAVCGNRIGNWEEYKKRFETRNTWVLSPVRLVCCSDRCMYGAIEINFLGKLQIKLRRLPALPYSMFVDHFKFNESGGYAKGKYELMKENPLLFFNSLDKLKIIKLWELDI